MLFAVLGASVLSAPAAEAAAPQKWVWKRLAKTPQQQAGPGAQENRGGGGSNESGDIQWRTVATNFDNSIWGEQEKRPDRISFVNGNLREIRIDLQDGDTQVAGSSDRGRERAELFLMYRHVEDWFGNNPYVSLSYELQLPRDFDGSQSVRGGQRRIFQVKGSKGSGKPIFDVVIQGGELQIRHYEKPKGRGKAVVLAKMPVPNVAAGEWIPISFEAKFTEGEDGYFNMRVGDLVAEYEGKTQFDHKLNNIKIGEYRNSKYSSGVDVHHVRNPVLKVGR